MEIGLMDICMVLVCIILRIGDDCKGDWKEGSRRGCGEYGLYIYIGD